MPRDGLPKVLSLTEIMSYYLEHRREVIRRRTQYDLDVCERRAHILGRVSHCIKQH